MKPKITVFAGPNGSGKSSLTDKCILECEYINADEIKLEFGLSDYDAAVEAERRREYALSQGTDFAFETVLSTERNLKLLERAKAQGYFIRGYYVLTCDPMINVARVRSRVEMGGHDVPKEKIVSRYHRALALLPRFIGVCDICSVYDNSLEDICKIYKKKYDVGMIFGSACWSKREIAMLVAQK